MRRFWLAGIVCVLGCVAFLGIGLVRAQPAIQATVSLDALQAALRELGLELSDLQTTTNGDVVSYTIEIQASVTKDGKLLSSSVRIAPEAVPDEVRAEAAKVAPGAMLEGALKKTKDILVSYRLFIRGQKGGGWLEVTEEPKIIAGQIQGDIALASVPEAVMAAATKQVPEGTLITAEQDFKGPGKIEYTLIFKTAKGRVEVELDAQGKVLEMEVPHAMVPAAALNAAMAAVPGGIAAARAIVDFEDGTPIYEVTFETAEGEVEVEVGADGKVIEVELESADDDDDEGENDDD